MNLYPPDKRDDRARDLTIPGRELKGIYFALDMLAQQNRILDGETFPKEQLVNARGKRVLDVYKRQLHHCLIHRYTQVLAQLHYKPLDQP